MTQGINPSQPFGLIHRPAGIATYMYNWLSYLPTVFLKKYDTLVQTLVLLTHPCLCLFVASLLREESGVEVTL